MPNTLGFDKIFKYIDENLIHPDLNVLIDNLRYKHNIGEWKGDPNYHLTNVSIKQVIKEMLNRENGSIEKLESITN